MPNQLHTFEINEIKLNTKKKSWCEMNERQNSKVNDFTGYQYTGL